MALTRHRDISISSPALCRFLLCDCADRLTVDKRTQLRYNREGAGIMSFRGLGEVAVSGGGLVA